MAIKHATELKCGGLVIGYAFNHRVADAHLANMFFVSWAEIAHAKPISHIPCFSDLVVGKLVTVSTRAGPALKQLVLLRLRLGLAYALWALCALAYQHSLSIESVEIHLPSLPELPPHYHTTNGLLVHLNSTLQKAFKMASPSFSNIFNTLSPDLIYDYDLPWAPTIASSYNISAVDFIPIGATMMSFSLHKLMKSSVEFPFQAIQFWGFHEMQFHNSMIKTAANKAKNKV
ncbi:hypothetical protein TEA_015151 [Camellia sinensis var. sinensis]|uniref:Uncharacterized protein n=1 Tax=Camellia sinensis var. sinensis TaxID=542762 RepID=A0A4V3WKW6_CAMSN|nr:hypothetical protein TEA_015151 [Camellia sinensis var. sinensis]